jgi:hypothetical protein
MKLEIWKKKKMDDELQEYETILIV